MEEKKEEEEMKEKTKHHEHNISAGFHPGIDTISAGFHPGIDKNTNFVHSCATFQSQTYDIYTIKDNQVIFSVLPWSNR